MEEWLVVVLCFSVCIVVCSCIEVLKKIIKCVAKKHDKTVDFAKGEYIITAGAFILTFGGVFALLYFAKLVPEYQIIDIIKVAGIVAGSTQSVYLFVVQAIRKGITGIAEAFCKVISKAKSEKNFKDKVIDISNSCKVNGQVEGEDEPIDFESFINNIKKK